MTETLVQSRDCAYLRIGGEIRRAIESGAFAPGCRIPTVSELAKRYKTSVFTIQSALKPLEKEGLIEQKRKVGIFVKGAKAQFRCAAIYFGGQDIWRIGEFEFLRLLHSTLADKLTKLGVGHQLFIDDRPYDESATPYPPLLKTIEKGEVQGVAVLEIEGERRHWLDKLPVPVATHTHGSWARGQVHFDYRSFVEGSLKEIKARGRGRPALITHLPEMANLWDKLCPELGLELRNEWKLLAENEWLTGRFERFGYEQALKLADMKHRPDSLVIYPDMAARGAVTGLLSKAVRVPDELLVVMHRNEGVDCPCPFPAIFGISSVDGVAGKFIAQLLAGIKGAGCPPLLEAFRFEDGGMDGNN